MAIFGGLLEQRAQESLRSPEDLQRNRNLSALGASLMEEGISDIAGRGTGKAVGDYLRAEWHRQEDMTFQATAGKEIQSQIEQSQNNYKLRTKLTTEIGVEGQDPAELRKGYYSEYAPDGAPVPTSFIPADDFMAVNQHLNTAASDMIGGLQGSAMQYMDAAAQYPNNPLIENRAKGLLTHIQQSFEGQLTAQKMAGEQMAQQEQLMDMQKKQEEAKFAEETLPIRKEAEVARLEGQVFDFRKQQIEARAAVARGREIAAADGVDVSTFDDNDSYEYYVQHQMKVEDAIKSFDLAKKSGKAAVPPGIDLTNVGDWLRFSPEGNAIMHNFVETEKQNFIGSSPETKKRIDDLAKARGFADGINDESLDDKQRATIRAEVINLDPEIRDAITAKAVRNATEYLINTGQLGASFGVGKGNKGVEMPTGEGMPPARIRLFESTESMMRELAPDQYTEEVQEEVGEIPETNVEGEYFSGDPEDPYGDESIPEDSPLNPQVQEREIAAMNNYEDWLTYFSANPNTPKHIKVSNAKRAMKDIDKAVENLRKRQALPGQELPEDAYDTELGRLKDMRANFELLAKDPENYVPVPTFGSFEAIKNARKMIKVMMEDVTDGVSYLEDPSYGNIPLRGQRRPGIFEPNSPDRPTMLRRAGGAVAEGARAVGRGAQRVHQGILESPVGPAYDASVPYWMATPEEKKARMGRFQKTLETGLL